MAVGILDGIAGDEELLEDAEAESPSSTDAFAAGLERSDIGA
jgi:hypothetical protein